MKVSGGIDGGQEVGLEAITTVLPVFEDIPMQGGGRLQKTVEHPLSNISLTLLNNYFLTTIKIGFSSRIWLGPFYVF